MSTMQLTVKKTGYDTFEFCFYRNEPATDLDLEFPEIVKVLDEGIDALMRLPKKLECEPLNSSASIHRIKIYVGGDAANK